MTPLHAPPLLAALLAAAVALALAGCERRPTHPRESVRPATTRGDTPATPPSATRPAADDDADDADDDAAEDARLYGTWVARDVDVALGEVKVQLTFRRDGPVRILAWSDLPFVGRVRNKTAPYEVAGNTLSSQALRGGTTVNYRFDGDDLIIEYTEGKTVRFKRQS